MEKAGFPRPARARTVLAGAAITACGILLAACSASSRNASTPAVMPAGAQADLIAEGKQIFRFDTFGDEIKWTDALRLHQVISAAVDPVTALSVGLKVDADALPPALAQGIKDGSIDLKSPATTIALLKLNAVVGLKGTVETVNGRDALTRVGTTCALCHSTVDNSFAPGIGKRLDGWANRDLNPGAIIALSPALDAAMKKVFNSWGKGRYDPRFNLDGISKPVVIPPAYGLAGIHSVTFTGEGAEPAYWNRYVAVTQMGGQGNFSDARLKLNITNGGADLVSGKLAALQAYQLSLNAPAAPAGSFDALAVARGKLLFAGAAKCASCHSGALLTDANSRLHPPGDSMAEPETPSYAARSASRQYRTSPLKGVWQHAPYFHDGSAATLNDVAARYNTRQSLGLSPRDIADLAEYLKSL